MARNLFYDSNFVTAMQRHLKQVARDAGLSGGGQDGGAAAQLVPIDSDAFTLYLLKQCPYCRSALEKVRQAGLLATSSVHFVEETGMSKGELLTFLRAHTDIAPRHATWPVIFKQGRFLGGSDSLDAWGLTA